MYMTLKSSQLVVSLYIWQWQCISFIANAVHDKIQHIAPVRWNENVVIPTMPQPMAAPEVVKRQFPVQPATKTGQNDNTSA